MSVWPGLLTGLAVFALLAVAVAVGSWFYFRRRNKQKEIVVKFSSDDHYVLDKDERLKEKLCHLTDNVEKLNEEFKEIEAQAKEEAKTRRTDTATKDPNKVHNRYADIGPPKIDIKKSLRNYFSSV